MRLIFCHIRKKTYLCNRKKRKFAREHSSVGSEHLPYKQRVIGSTPIVPTKERFQNGVSFFCNYPSPN